MMLYWMHSNIKEAMIVYIFFMGGRFKIQQPDILQHSGMANSKTEIAPQDDGYNRVSFLLLVNFAGCASGCAVMHKFDRLYRLDIWWIKYIFHQFGS